LLEYNNHPIFNELPREMGDLRSTCGSVDPYRVLCKDLHRAELPSLQGRAGG